MSEADASQCCCVRCVDGRSGWRLRVIRACGAGRLRVHIYKPPQSGGRSPLQFFLFSLRLFCFLLPTQNVSYSHTYSLTKMMTTRFMNAFVLFFLALVAVVSALPLAKRDVFVPHITYPHDGTVWKAGHKHNVTWCVLDGIAWPRTF